MSVTAAQDRLRCLIWDDFLTYLKEKSPGELIIQELEGLRVA